MRYTPHESEKLKEINKKNEKFNIRKSTTHKIRTGI